MNGAINRKVLIVLGPVAGIVMFLAVVWMASVFVGHNEYKEPYRAPAAAADATPRAEGLAAEKAAAETKAKATPYTEAEYRHWHDFFKKNPGAFEVKTDIAETKNVPIRLELFG